jgi:hypothetical protein
MGDTLISVTEYHLAGGGQTIALSMKDPADPHLVYEGPEGKREFAGMEIRQESTQLGLLLSVLLEEVPDLHSVILSLAVPRANRPDSSRSIPVETFSVRTTRRDNIAGPDSLEGQIELYETCELAGNAW